MVKCCINGRTTFKQLIHIDDVPDSLATVWSGEVTIIHPPSPLTLVTSASDTNPLSLQSISVHIRRRSARCSAVRRYGSRALIRSQLMMVGAAMARVVSCHAPSRVTR